MTPRDLGFIFAGRWIFRDPRCPVGRAVWANVYRLDPQGRLVFPALAAQDEGEAA